MAAEGSSVTADELTLRGVRQDLETKKEDW